MIVFLRSNCAVICSNGMKITQAILDSLTEQAKGSPRLRMNLDLRDSDSDGRHVIAFYLLYLHPKLELLYG